MAKSVHAVQTRPVAIAGGIGAEGEWKMALMGSWTGRQVPAGCEANFPLRYPGAGPAMLQRERDRTQG